MEEAKKVGLNERRKHLDPNLFGLLEMCVYGMKGGCSYFYHAEELRSFKHDIYSDEERKDVYEMMIEIMKELCNPNPTLESLLA